MMSGLVVEGSGLGLKGLGAMDWKETEEAHIFKFDPPPPGLTKEDVKLQLHDRQLLHLSTTVSSRCEDEEDLLRRRNIIVNGTAESERAVSPSFRREFRLPENAIADDIEAWMRDGVLVVRVGKKHLHATGKKHIRHRVKIEDDIADSMASKPKPKGRLTRFVCCKAA